MGLLIFMFDNGGGGRGQVFFLSFFSFVLVPDDETN